MTMPNPIASSKRVMKMKMRGLRMLAVTNALDPWRRK